MNALHLTYAIVPPNRTTPLERQRGIAAEQSARIAQLPIDALLIYDVQDEAARNASARPFSFVPKVDPLTYAFEALRVGSLPRIVYRAVAGQSESTLCSWLDTLQALGGRPVLVGAPARDAVGSLSLQEALALCQQRAPALELGGVLIPERHQASGAEDVRVLSKMRRGCRFFVSQTVWCTATAKRFLRDLRLTAELEGEATPPLLFTFSPCGSPQTLSFLQWLGVAMPDSVKRELLSAKDMLARSIELSADAFAEIRAFAEQQGLAVGCNVESLTTRTSEVDASIELLQRVRPAADSSARQSVPGEPPRERHFAKRAPFR